MKPGYHEYVKALEKIEGCTPAYIIEFTPVMTNECRYCGETSEKVSQMQHKEWCPEGIVKRYKEGDKVERLECQNYKMERVLEAILPEVSIDHNTSESEISQLIDYLKAREYWKSMRAGDGDVYLRDITFPSSRPYSIKGE